MAKKGIKGKPAAETATEITAPEKHLFSQRAIVTIQDRRTMRGHHSISHDSSLITT
jgi:hypothetical protein